MTSRRIIDQARESARAEGRQEVFDRARTIANLPEAKGREQLASHLSLNTDMSIEEIRAALVAAPCGNGRSTRAACNTVESMRRLLISQGITPRQH